MNIQELERFNKALKQIDFIERGGRTERMHTVPTLKSQNVAAHSYGVAWLCWLFSKENPSMLLIMAALSHDVAEHVTGDAPAPTKRYLGIREAVARWEDELIWGAGLPVFGLEDEEVRILKLADATELIMHCVREVQLGNRTPQLNEMFSNASAYAHEVAQGEFEHDFVSTLEKRWET